MFQQQQSGVSVNNTTCAKRHGLVYSGCVWFNHVYAAFAVTTFMNYLLSHAQYVHTKLLYVSGEVCIITCFCTSLRLLLYVIHCSTCLPEEQHTHINYTCLYLPLYGESSIQVEQSFSRLCHLVVSHDKKTGRKHHDWNRKLRLWDQSQLKHIHFMLCWLYCHMYMVKSKNHELCIPLYITMYCSI